MRLGILVGAVLLACAPGAAIAGFGGCNAASLTIPASGSASPYPSQIVLSASPTLVTTVSVSIQHYSHTYSNDVGIVLVDPEGRAMELQDGVTDDVIADVTYNISDSGSSVLPDVMAFTQGTYRPTSYFGGDAFPAPGPGTAYANPGPAASGTATMASTFGGSNSNGTWRLYVQDFVAGDSGTIAGGWCVYIDGSFDRVFSGGFDYAP